MKKMLIALAICSLVVFALVTTVMADNGPHGSFAANTAACAGCHRVHTASFGSNALLVADPEALCESCHAGFGAGTNVADGVYVGTAEGTNGGSLMGGGFENALMATLWSGKYSFDATFNAASKPTTSHHNLGTSGTVWGSGANNSTPGTYVMECTSCHDPHGSAGWKNNARVASYRLLRWQPNGSDGFTAPATPVNWSGGNFVDHNGVPTSTVSVSGWLVPDNFPGAEWYTIGTGSAFATGDYSAGGPQTGANPPTGNANGVYQPTGFNYIPAAQAVSYFCAQCHDRYLNNSRLRNNTDISAYCNGGNPATVLPPTGPSSVSPIDPTYCLPFFVNNAWVWGDNRPSGDNIYMYRHTSGDLRASMDGTVSADTRTSLGRACVACHVAHGTTAASNTLASNATLAGSSALLRMDNRSICLRCHAGGVNYTIAP
jgi:predicted CXXCH cytochrome family protein